jgi:hypothetical protein
MPDRLTFSHAGQEYVADRQAGPGPASNWQITRAGAPVTSFPASDGDTTESVRAKVIEWLRGNEDRPAADVNRQ